MSKFGNIFVFLITVALLCCGIEVARSQVVNGDFSGGATGWTTSTPSDGTVTYTGGNLTANSDNNGGGFSTTVGRQSLTRLDPGFLSFTLLQYASTDIGTFDYPTVQIGGTFFRITPAGVLTTSAATGIDNNDATIAGVSGFTNLATGTSNIGFGVVATDSCCGRGVAQWDNIEFQQLTQSPGAQTVDMNSSVSVSGVQVATNGPNSINVTLAVSNGTITVGTAGVTVTGNGTATVTLVGTPAAINTAMAGLTYTPTPGFSGSDNLIFTAVGNGLTDSDTIPITINPFLYTINKSASLATVTNASQTINYTIILDNTGGAPITGISLTDTLVQGGSSSTLTLSGPTGDGGVVGTLEVTEIWTYTVSHSVTQAQIDDGANLVNTVVVSSNEAATISDDATTNVNGVPSLSLTKTASATGFTTGNIVNAPAGTVVTYSYVVTNDGDVTVDGVSVADVHGGAGTPPSPAGEALTTDSAPALDSTDPSGSDGTWDFLAPGDAVTFTGTYTILQDDVDTLQ